MLTFIIQHDLLFIVTVALVIGTWLAIILDDADFFFPFAALFFILLSLLSCLNAGSVTWEDAKVCQTIPVAELKLIELPNHTVQIWYNNGSIDTINTIQDYLRRDQIGHIEIRCLEVFGPDFYKQKVIFKQP